MNYKLMLLCFLTSSFLMLNAEAQGVKLDGTNIYVTDGTSPILKFGNTVQGITPSCPKCYKIAIDGDNAQIFADNVSAEDDCTLLISEGARKPYNQYRFNLIYKKKGKVNQYYDFSTDEKIDAFKSSSAEREKPIGPSPDDNAKNATGQAEPKKKNFTQSDEDNEDLAVEGEYGITKEKLEKEVNIAIKAFTTLTSRIASHKDVRANVTKAMTLFNNDTTKIVETLSKNSQPRARPVKKYLNDLNNTGYKAVDIQAKNIQFVSSIQKVGENHYQAVVEILQDYQAYSGKELQRIYHDQTSKTFNIEIMVWETVEQGQTLKKWTIFLGDIKAKEILND